MNHRRKTLAAFGFLLGTAAAIAAPKPPEARPVQIASGKILGVLSQDQQVIAYKGIPYAAPPLEDLRWRAPQQVNKWRHILFAHDFGSHCIQFGTAPDIVFSDPGPSEDCLTLNIWTPATAAPDKKSPGLPVMVWIYGGGFAAGGTSQAGMDGQSLARRGVIVVTMNYRLGIFGFFSHPELDTESGTHSSGNYGLMDQAFALAWVRQNIAAFGGDPANVTVFGESAGAFSVSTLMASPIAKSLFAKAIGESGAAFYSTGLSYPAREVAEQRNTAWAERVFGSSKLFFLRTLTTEDVVKATASRTNPPPPFGPIIDGHFLPDAVPDIYADGKQAHIPLLAGWNADEQKLPALTTADSFKVRVHTGLAANAPKFLEVYPAATDAEATQSANDFTGDRFIAFSTWEWIEAQSKAAPVYRYFFTLASPGDRNHPATEGAFHGDEIEYAFGTLDTRPRMNLRPEDRALSDLMQQYWTNFAKSPTGDPNAPGLPQWPIYNAAGNYPVMHLDATPHAQPDTLRPRYLFLDSLWGSTAAKQ